MKSIKRSNIADRNAVPSRIPNVKRGALIAALLLLGCGILSRSVWVFPHWEKAAAASSAAQPQEPQISPVALRQIRALSLEKDTRTAGQQKIDSQLLYALRKQRGEALAQPLETNIGATPDGKIAVEITAHINDVLLQKLTNDGAEILASLPALRSLSAKVAFDHLEEIAGWPEVIFLQPQREDRASDNLTSFSFQVMGGSRL